MEFQFPLTFVPLYMERVWGGRRLEELLNRQLPTPDAPIGESWELVDRADAQSVVSDGPYAGLSLHDLWITHRQAVFGDCQEADRFPVLAKILDARETLSVQVHPPAGIAAELGGEAKTEMWYVLDATDNAVVYAGFRRGTTKEAFIRSLEDGTVEDLLHKIPVKRGDAVFIPSGRCHAIGAGCLMVEIQQNSDTTYRVFDFNRMGLDGKPRPLHVDQSLLSIDFDDFVPELVAKGTELVVGSSDFRVERWDLPEARNDVSASGVLFTVLEGSVKCGGRHFQRGEFFLLPASARDRGLVPVGASASVLRSTVP